MLISLDLNDRTALFEDRPFSFRKVFCSFQTFAGLLLFVFEFANALETFLGCFQANRSMSGRFAWWNWSGLMLISDRLSALLPRKLVINVLLARPLRESAPLEKFFCSSQTLSFLGS